MTRKAGKESFDSIAYRNAAAAATGLAIPEACRDEVASNLARTEGFAALVLDFVPEAGVGYRTNPRRKGGGA